MKRLPDNKLTIGKARQQKKDWKLYFISIVSLMGMM
jgi:hypothetical protein